MGQVAWMVTFALEPCLVEPQSGQLKPEASTKCTLNAMEHCAHQLYLGPSEPQCLL